MEHDLDALTAINPITGNTDKLSSLLADQAEMKLLHMVTASPARTPTFTMFGNDNYFFFTAKGGACVNQSDCVSEETGFAWNHGDFQRDITRNGGTWREATRAARQRLLGSYRPTAHNDGAARPEGRLRA